MPKRRRLACFMTVSSRGMSLDKLSYPSSMISLRGNSRAADLPHAARAGGGRGKIIRNPAGAASCWFKPQRYFADENGSGCALGPCRDPQAAFLETSVPWRNHRAAGGPQARLCIRRTRRKAPGAPRHIIPKPGLAPGAIGGSQRIR